MLALIHLRRIRLRSESSMLVATSILKYENARKPLMALILTFSQREKGLEGIPIFIPMTGSGEVISIPMTVSRRRQPQTLFFRAIGQMSLSADKNASIAAASSWGLW